MAISEKRKISTRQKISQSQKKRWEKVKSEKQELIDQAEALNQRKIAIAATNETYKTLFNALDPEMVRSALFPSNGTLVSWSDYCDWMLNNDSQIRACVEKRMSMLSADKLIVKPNNQLSQNSAMAADMIRTWLKGIKGFDKVIKKLHKGVFTGVTMLEIVYDFFDEVSQTYKIKEIDECATRNIEIKLVEIDEFGNRIIEENLDSNIYGKWSYLYRDNNGKLFDAESLYPDKFIFFSPGNEYDLRERGLLRVVAMTYFYKYAAYTYMLSGAQKFANPTLIAKVNKNASAESSQALVQALRELDTQGALVVDSDTEIDAISPGATGGTSVWQQAIDILNSDIMKVLLGGTLTLDQTSTGSYALGDVHWQGFMALVNADASAISNCIREQIAKPLLELNKHLFAEYDEYGDVVYPCIDDILPLIEFETHAMGPIPTEFYELLITDDPKQGIITLDEARQSIGLPRVGGVRGSKFVIMPSGYELTAPIMEEEKEIK